MIKRMLLVPLLTLVASAAMAADVPTINIKQTCETSSKTIKGLFGDIPAASYDNCVSEEQEARDKIVQGWSGYPAGDKALCVQPKGYMPSYVEWLTCFEMQHSVRDLRHDEPEKAETGGRSRKRHPRG
jgi:hypothetical protein